MRQARGIAAAALGVLLALLASAPARALCVNSTACSRCDQGHCVQYTTHTCPNSPPPPPSYGAIAYGRTSTAWGFSDHWDSQAKAESVAKENCAQRGEDCEPIVWFKNQCGAVASGVAWGLGGSDGQARAAAQEKCVEGGGKNCEVQTSVCSK